MVVRCRPLTKDHLSLKTAFSGPKGWSLVTGLTVYGFSIVHRLQYTTVQYSTVQYSTVQYSTVQYSTVQYSTVQYNTVRTVQARRLIPQFFGIRHSTVQYSKVQYSTRGVGSSLTLVRRKCERGVRGSSPGIFFENWA